MKISSHFHSSFRRKSSWVFHKMHRRLSIFGFWAWQICVWWKIWRNQCQRQSFPKKCARLPPCSLAIVGTSKTSIELPRYSYCHVYTMVSLRLKTLASLYADDADVPQVQHYRLFLKEHVVFKEAITIKNPLTLSKIHQMCRVGYLKDVVLARVLDEATATNLSSIIHSNNAIDDSTFIQELFARLRSTTTSAESKKNLVTVDIVEFFTILITNICNLLKSSQHTRHLLCSSKLGINSCCDYDTINLPETFMITHISDNTELSFSFFLEKRNESDFTCMFLSLKPSLVFYIKIYIDSICKNKFLNFPMKKRWFMEHWTNGCKSFTNFQEEEPMVACYSSIFNLLVFLLCIFQLLKYIH
ncbi:hypothetical protein CXB51_008317 [Gossypium anomalum]|uniref:Serine/threonine-protein phosphatase 4 regulatory subunit 3-like central domain-containing protein n=1 Tax=Gossypium anomalum TaxID=47600 RepID=A0A8J5YWE9_9ROSI|nr:hypothetical protein CXB51_008317 [Gossypium anomalum]